MAIVEILGFRRGSELLRLIAMHCGQVSALPEHFFDVGVTKSQR